MFLPSEKMPGFIAITVCYQWQKRDWCIIFNIKFLLDLHKKYFFFEIHNASTVGTSLLKLYPLTEKVRFIQTLIFAFFLNNTLLIVIIVKFMRSLFPYPVLRLIHKLNYADSAVFIIEL